HTRSDRDWSSDVCSSDLLAVAHEAGKGDLVVVIDHRREVVVVGTEDEARESAGRAGRGHAGPDCRRRRRRLPHPDALVIGYAVEIGRASCRERVESWWVG